MTEITIQRAPHDVVEPEQRLAASLLLGTQRTAQLVVNPLGIESGMEIELGGHGRPAFREEDGEIIAKTPRWGKRKGEHRREI